MDLPRSELLKRLQALDPYEFEKFVADVWEYMGWETTVTQQAGDRGKDIVARKELPFKQKQLIQVKRYARHNRVDIAEVQQYGSLYLDKSPTRDVDADVVALVTTSSLTKPAQEKAQEINVRVVDGERLTRMVTEWDLSGIVGKYIESGSDSRPDFQRQVEDLEDSDGWNMIEAFNSQERSSTGENLKLTATADGSVAYELYHGHSHQDQLSERKNIHYVRGIDDQQLDHLKYIADDLNMRLLVADEDGWRIFDKGESEPKAHRTVEIGARILSGVYGIQFEQATFDVEVGREDSAPKRL
ncbi:restriction endonuclease [Halorubrum sp. ASP1]|uniref:restriction endonuclease n=1 Tax=Halorubrum sp. ASP1 TaxID=2518114 RepID=UPI0010F6484A|nr:restriction endonuclease [Halorubrum sp. ASP1]TKX60757.1 restriction endonuclease [Halorubrum sp. ASP1]